MNSKYTLDENEGFTAMRHFLVKWSLRHGGSSDQGIQDIRMLLGEITRLKDGIPGDPASWDDWLQSIESAKANIPDNEVRD